MKSVLIGYGYWGKILERYLKEDQDVEYIGVSDKFIKESLPMNTILEDDSIKAVYVCTPVDTHYEVVSELLQHGKHVFCEKPLCKTKKEVDMLYDIAKKTDCALYTDYIYINSPSINLLKENLYDLGNVLFVDMSIRQFGNFYPYDNVMDVLGVHMLSVLAYLFDPKSFEIKEAKEIVRSTQGLAEECIVELVIAGIPCRINCSLISHFKERKICIVCERGRLIFDMLGESTFFKIKHEVDGYKKNERIEMAVKCDEKNNLKQAISSFQKSIKNKCDNNKRIALFVSDALETINSILNNSIQY